MMNIEGEFSRQLPNWTRCIVQQRNINLLSSVGLRGQTSDNFPFIK